MDVINIYSDLEGTERLYSVLLTEPEMALFSSKDDDSLKLKDKLDLWSNKHLLTKREREATINAYKDRNDSSGDREFARVLAKRGGISGALAGGLTGAMIGGLSGGKKAALGALIGSGYGGVVGSGGGYIGTRLGLKGNKALRKRFEKFDEQNLKAVDLMRVSNGDMTKSEFKKKYYK